MAPWRMRRSVWVNFQKTRAYFCRHQASFTRSNLLISGLVWGTPAIFLCYGDRTQLLFTFKGFVCLLPCFLFVFVLASAIHTLIALAFLFWFAVVCFTHNCLAEGLRGTDVSPVYLSWGSWQLLSQNEAFVTFYRGDRATSLIFISYLGVKTCI